MFVPKILYSVPVTFIYSWFNDFFNLKLSGFEKRYTNFTGYRVIRIIPNLPEKPTRKEVLDFMKKFHLRSVDPYEIRALYESFPKFFDDPLIAFGVRKVDGTSVDLQINIKAKKVYELKDSSGKNLVGFGFLAADSDEYPDTVKPYLKMF